MKPTGVFGGRRPDFGVLAFVDQPLDVYVRQRFLLEIALFGLT